MLGGRDMSAGAGDGIGQVMGASTHPTAILTQSRRLRRIAGAVFLLGMGALPAYATYAGPDVVRAGIENCVTGLETGRFADDADLVEFKAAEVARLVETFRLSHTPDAAWAHQNSEWVMIVSERQCEIISFRRDPQRMAEAWNNEFAVLSPTFRGDAATSKQNGKGLWRATAFASRPVSSGFIQMTLNSFEVRDVGAMTTVVAVRVGQTPASCEIWPEECSQ